MKKKIILIAIFIAVAAISNAEPGNAVKFLMNEPVSIFDFGIYRLQELLKEPHIIKNVVIDEISPSVWVGYNYEDNLITINMIYTLDKNGKEVDQLKTAVNYYKNFLKIRIRFKETPSQTVSKLSNCFSHLFISEKNPIFLQENVPDNLLDELEKITEITALTINCNCSSKLSDESMNCSP